MMPTILITGAGRGFGRALLDVYHQRGWDLFPLVRRGEIASRIEEDLKPACHPIIADVASPEVENEIAAALESRASSLDVLINNAGNIKKLRWLPATEPEDIESLFKVHCLGAFRCTRAALPFLRKAARPIVVNLTSRWGSISRTTRGEFRGIYSYQIAKCAQNMLSACLDHELKGEGIRVFAVHPGQLTTESGAFDAATPPEAAASRLADWIRDCDDDRACGCHDLMRGTLIPW